MSKSILKDFTDKSRKQMVLEARKMLKQITDGAINWYDNLEKKKDIKPNEVIASNVRYIKELVSVIVSLDARLQVLENEELFKIQNTNKSYEWPK